ncbi:SAV_2336 N-terminal domain-related protein [Bradyrhizobium sp. 150]|uniref:SAV_2336 N-terminal domain-related protein n=1 Tax=Bradyrhizobium sp. 150 TaxID=2782625 RepID=UPI001FFB7E01|nr:SAV_2336 N-terminal domain-related protein [Bradyrhizobium sp. 150]MCK1675240.1 response regulator [Bradyrhizobium sp. 150]
MKIEKLDRFIEILEQAGLEVNAPFLLDAIWLAAQERELEPVSVAPVGPSNHTDLGSPLNPAAMGEQGLRETTNLNRPDREGHDGLVIGESRLAGEQLNTIAAYAGGDPFQAGRRASTFAVVTAAPRFDTLAFSRAVRPLRQRIASPHIQMLDEEATTDLTAKLSAPGTIRLHAATMPAYERWFDVHVVTEDDAATELWQDSLRIFAATLRNSGAFRDVREWRLELPKSEKGVPLLRAGEHTVSALSLNGNERRIILFASHGSSPHWSTGANRSLLAQWGTNCSVAMLHLLPSNSWARTALGEPLGLASTHRPGSSSAELTFSPFWWLPMGVSLHTGPLPLVELRADSIKEWASMLMARGQSTPALPLSSLAPSRRTGDQEKEDESTISRRIGALLSASPRTFQLAALLSIAPFTVPVARLVQEANFGQADHEELTQLFLSGLLRLLPGQSHRRFSSWFMIDPIASAILRRSVRASDADALATAIFQRVSDHIARATGQRPAMTSFVLDQTGKYAIPDWAKPFALVASHLRSHKPESKPDEATAFDNLWQNLNPQHQAALLRIGIKNSVLQNSMVPQDVWSGLLDRTITELDENGDRRFTVKTRGRLAKIDENSPLLGAQILWVDDRPENNERVARRFATLGAEIKLARSTESAIELLKQRRFTIIISDMARREGDREGFSLLAQMQKISIKTPVIMFAARFARSRANRAAVVRAGAYFCTNKSDDLEQHVIRLYREPGAPADEVFEDVSSSAPGYVSRLQLRDYGLEPITSETTAIRQLEFRSVFLVGSMLVELDERLTGPLRRIVLDQLLFSDLAANAQSPSARVGLADRFNEILQSVGWVVIDHAYYRHDVPLGRAIHEALPELLDQEDQRLSIQSILPELLRGLEEPASQPFDWVQVFERRIASLELDQFQVGFVEAQRSALRFHSKVFRVHAEMATQQILFFRARDSKTQIEVEEAVFELAIESALSLQSLIQQRVAPYWNNQVMAVEPPFPGKMA